MCVDVALSHQGGVLVMRAKKEKRKMSRLYSTD